MTAYRLAFLASAVFALVGVAFSLSIHDSDAAETIVPAAQTRTTAGQERCRHGARGQRGVTPARAVCVFCGSSPGTNPAFTDAAAAFGRGLAERGVGLVYGGASIGLMGVVADAAIAAGGRATGVITESLAGHEIAHVVVERPPRRQRPCTSARP